MIETKPYSIENFERLLTVVHALSHELATEIDLHYDLQDAEVVFDAVLALKEAISTVTAVGGQPHDVVEHVVQRFQRRSQLTKKTH
ncbi:hypothetical protein [Octadecabacter sp. R77987]|uniref:hypothetical protein n=1 Tax=Octadecabacter sp. R77987 TaxID=3093874 RepID=UPI00366D497F